MGEVSEWPRPCVCNDRVLMWAGDRERERKIPRPNKGELGPVAEWCAGTDGPLGVVADRTGRE